jgi:type II secretory pathway component GspD/PulD (secretin)
MLKAVITTLLLSVALTLAQDTGKTFQNYPIFTPDVEALVKMTQSMGAKDDRILYDKSSSQILVYASPEVHANIKAILKDVNVLPKNVMLEVVIHEAGKSASAAATLGLAGKVTISRSGTHSRMSASPSISSRTSKSDQMTSQKLLLRSGSEAVISVGTEVPFLSYLLVLGRDWGYLQPEIEIKQVGASLRAKAVVVGDTDIVTVTLTPELSGLVGSKITRIRYTKVATTVSIRNGETITLGSFGNNKGFYNKFLAGFERGNKSKAANITLTANIQQPTGRIK